EDPRPDHPAGLHQLGLGEHELGGGRRIVQGGDAVGQVGVVGQFCCGTTPRPKWAAWACTSTMPGKTVLPVMSISRLPAGMATSPRRPTATMRSPRTSTTP